MSSPLKIRILLADDHALVRRGLRMVLDSQPDLEVVAEVGDGAQAVQRALEPDVDLAILDVTMPRMTGLAAARELGRRRPELRVLILSMHENEQFLYEALKAGASGYVLKSAADRDLVEACRAAMRGEPFLYPGAVTALIRERHPSLGQHPDDLVADRVGVRVEIAQDAHGDTLVLAHQAKQDVLGPDVVVAKAQGLAQRELEDLLGPRGEGDQARGDFLAGADDPDHLRTDPLNGDVKRLEHAGGGPLLLAEQAKQDVLGPDVIALEGSSLFLRQDDHFAGALGKSLKHDTPQVGSSRGERPALAATPRSALT